MVFWYVKNGKLPPLRMHYSHNNSPDPRAKRIQNQVVQFGKTSSEHILQCLDQKGEQKPIKNCAHERFRYPHILQIHAKGHKPDDISHKQVCKRKPVPASDQVNISLKKRQNNFAILTQAVYHKWRAEYRNPHHNY